MPRSYRPEEEDLSEPLPFALLASRFSLSVLLAAFLSFAPPLSLLAMVSSLERAAEGHTLTNSACRFNCLTRRHSTARSTREKREAQALPGPLMRGTFSR
jgi:hypothetical protein